MATSYYSTGTVSLTNGSAVVTGNGTGWQLALISGGNVIVQAPGNLLPIASVDSDSQITAELEWTGATGTYAYTIQRDTAYLQSLDQNSQNLSYLLSELRAGTIFKYDQSGDLAGRDLYDARPKNFGYLVTIGVSQPVFYVKASNTDGDWAGPFPYGTGPVGPQGPIGVLNPRGTYSAGTAYAPNDNVLYNGSSWVALQATTGNAPPTLPTTENAYWSLLAVKGQDGAGIGDMVAASYDPQSIQDDVFDRANHTGTQPIGSVEGLSDTLAGIVTPKVFDLSPLYLDQITMGFHGRGMLAAETNDLVTEQAIAATSAAGATTITATDATDLLAATNVTVKHDNGRYWTYWVAGKSGNVLTIYPSLKWDVSAAGGAMLERAWYNRAHAGKFYMRQLAQRLVYTDQLHMQIPQRGRLFFTQFINNVSDPNDQLTAFGSGASVSYWAASSTATGGGDEPVRFGQRATAFLSLTEAGTGAFTPTDAISTTPGSVCVARLIFKQSSPDLVAKAIVLSLDSGSPVVLAEKMLPSGTDSLVQSVVTFAFRIPAGVSTAYIRFDGVSVPTPAALGVSQIEVFAARPYKGNFLQETSGLRILVAGDSWASGDAVSTPERESFAVQLATELPQHTIINGGIGGATLWSWLPSFESTIADEYPDVVILHTGVNEVYTPASATFNPNHLVYFNEQMGQFLSGCMAIGAKPIIIGTPALAEEDAGSGFSSWLLNERATLQAAYLYENL